MKFMLSPRKNISMIYSPNQTSKLSATNKKSCNCRNSRCLKLYCECFASGEYCTDCNCQDCYNCSKHESQRKEAIQSILERNPLAFRPKISTLPLPGKVMNVAVHAKGCACKKSNCLKRYCECFQAGVSCSDECKCCEW